MNTKLKIILAVFLLVFIGLGWFLNEQFHRNFNLCWPYCQEMTNQDREDIKSVLEAEKKDWKIYKNKKYGFEFKYNKEWEVSDTPEGVQINPGAGGLNLMYVSYNDCKTLTQIYSGRIGSCVEMGNVSLSDIATNYKNDEQTKEVIDQIALTFKFTN